MEFLASDRVQLAVIFGLGFLVSRLFVVTGLAERSVLLLVRKVHGSPALVSLSLILSATILSSFIPNMISVLTLLPALKLLIERLTPLDAPRSQRRKVATYLTCSLIWGANIGGSSSLTGSPANLLLIFFLELQEMPGRSGIGFLTWLFWGVPLVLVFNILAWAVGRIFFRGIEKGKRPDPPPLQPASPRIRETIGVSLAILLFSTGVSVLGFLTTSSSLQLRLGLNGLTVATALLFIWILFFPNPLARRLGVHRPLLLPRDCWSGLPVRGLVFAGAVVVVLAGFARWAQGAGLDTVLAEWLRTITPEGTALGTVLLTLSTATIFLTEFMSNTLVATALFYSAIPLADALGISALPLFVAISMASTCAFMTPVATPVNSLAFGEIRGISVGRMMAAGAILIILGAVLITIVCSTLVPAILRLVEA